MLTPIIKKSCQLVELGLGSEQEFVHLTRYNPTQKFKKNQKKTLKWAKKMKKHLKMSQKT